MADFYVYSGSAQDDSDANWNSSTLAFLDLATCLADASVVAGSDVWVAYDHAKTYGADTTLANAGTPTSPIKITCVNRTTGAVTTGAKEQTIVGSYYLYAFQNNIIVDGVDFTSGDYITTDTDSTIIYKNATFELITAGTDSIHMSYGDQRHKWEEVVFKTNYSAHHIRLGSGVNFEWSGGGLDPAGTAIVELFRCLAGGGSSTILRNLDISNITGNVIEMNTLISVGIHNIQLIGCKLPSGVPLLDTDTLSLPHVIDAWSCDNGDGYFYFKSVRLEGVAEQAVNCYRTATYDGTNGYSAKLVSNANALDSKRPLRFKLAELWADANPTLTVETITDNVTLQDDEFWLEVEYPDGTDSALRNIDSTSRQTVGWSGGSGPGTPSNLTTSSETWTEDLTTEVKQKTSVTISGGAAGAHTVWACLAKPSTTVYVCPEVDVT